MRPTNFSASSFNTSNGCECRYWLEKGLGYYHPGGLAASLGSVTHSVLEAFAHVKIAKQNGQDFIEMEQLEGKATLDIIENRIDLVHKMLDWHKKTDSSHITFKPADIKKIYQWVDEALSKLNPLDLDNIIGAEIEFNLDLGQKWAKIAEDQQLKIKGFIDLVYIHDDILNITDWKSGRRQDFYTGKEKTYEALLEDFQLLLYFYAANILYPEYAGNIAVNIFFINDGGLFTVYFDEKDLTKVEKLLQKKFEHLKAMKIPRQNKSWRCKQFCPFAKVLHSDPAKQIVEFRPGKLGPIGQPMALCEHMHYLVTKHGIEWVEENYKVEKKT